MSTCTWLTTLVTMVIFIILCDCHVDPECHMTTPQIIEYYGHKVETHNVTTEDGYILTIHRIIQKSAAQKGVVFLQHGLLDSSATWVMNTYNNSLGFVLAQAGYDVWLGNVRGNCYSQKHITLTTTDPEYWNFSFDEHAKYDLPAMLEYVLKNSRNRGLLSYVGHSQGTLMALIEFSRNKELASKINLFTALAPVGRVNKAVGAFKLLSDILPEIVAITDKLGIYDFAPLTPVVSEFAILLCPVIPSICSEVFYVIAGPDEYLNSTRVPVYGSHAPAGTSLKNILHWDQIYQAKQPQMWDYGSAAENLAHYNKTKPPVYQYTGLQVPTIFFSGGNDYLGDPEDVLWLIGQLHPGVLKQSYTYDGYAHLSCLWALNAREWVFDKIIQHLEGVW